MLIGTASFGASDIIYLMGGSEKKNGLQPSYEEGKLRDPAIEKMQDKSFGPKDLVRLIKKAVKKAPSGA